MEKIWANRLLVGDRFSWDDVPEDRKEGVAAELMSRVESGKITEEQYDRIVEEEA